MLNDYLGFILRCELNQHKADFLREVCFFIPREKWRDYIVIGNCKCPNEGQDALYGKDRRVMNKTSKEATFRCTSCGQEQRTDGGKVGKK